mgnify:CR=1 FL=1
MAKPIASRARPKGSGANMPKGLSEATPDGRLRLAATSKSLSRIIGDEPTMVSEPPSTMQVAIGSSRRPSPRPVREDNLAATGRNSAVTEGFCMTEETAPAAALV